MFLKHILSKFVVIFLWKSCSKKTEVQRGLISCTESFKNLGLQATYISNRHDSLFFTVHLWIKLRTTEFNSLILQNWYPEGWCDLSMITQLVNVWVGTEHRPLLLGKFSPIQLAGLYYFLLLFRPQTFISALVWHLSSPRGSL